MTVAANTAGKPDFELVLEDTSSKYANQELRKSTLRDLADFWFEGKRPGPEMSNNNNRQLPPLAAKAAARSAESRLLRKSVAMMRQSPKHSASSPLRRIKRQWKFRIEQQQSGAAAQFHIDVPLSSVTSVL